MEAQGSNIPSSLGSAPSPAGGMVQQLIRCAPVATWCLVGLGALSFLWATIDNRFDQQDKRFDQIDARLDRMDRREEERFNQMEGRFNQMEGRFNQMEERFNQMEERFNRIDVRLDQLLQQSGQ